MNTETKKLFHRLQAIIGKHKPKDDTLLGGSLGLTYYYLNLYKIFGDEIYAEHALDLVEDAANLIGSEEKGLFGAAYSTGGSGLGYVIQSLYNEGLLEMNLAEELNDLDEYIYNTAMHMIVKDGNMDFLHGAAGAIHYFTHRLPGETVYERTKELVTAFMAKKIAAPGGTWFSNYIMEDDDRTEINFSLSHGQTGFLIPLMNAYRRGIELPEILSVVESGVNLILSHRLYPQPGDDSVSLFPSVVKSKEPDQHFASNRLAWCYGDMNILILLYEAASFLNRPAWKTLADELGEIITKRKAGKETAVFDSHFCHGTAGLVQTCKRLYNLSGMKMYDDAAAYWLQQTVDMVATDLEKDFYQTKETSLLEGLVGVNLVLASSLTQDSPHWGSFLLV